MAIPLFSSDALAGKRVLITGGGTGLGRGLTQHLVAHGAEVHLWGRREAKLSESAVAASAGHPEARVYFRTVDIRDAEMVDAAMGEIWDQHGALTGLINNAAANFLAPTADLSPQAYRAITSTVMDGSFYTTHAAGRRWIEGHQPGVVLSMLATWVWSGSAFVVPSAMAKSAVHAMTMSLAVEWAQHNIRVNAVAPGPIPTDYAWEALNPTDKSSVGATQADQVPMGRLGTIDELAALITFLLSDACPYLTGETIAMDGGQRLAGPNTFAGLTSLSGEDWAEIRQRTTASSDAGKAQRAV